jgi:hypothetical protein
MPANRPARPGRSGPFALAASRIVVRILVAANLVAGVLILALLVASLVARDWVFSALGADASDASWVIGGRLVMLLGVASVGLAHLVLTRLLEIIETVRSGDPFVARNAARLQTAAWALLGLELLHQAVQAIASIISTPSHPLDVGESFSITRWLAVLLLLVLARVFEHGTRMRDDLEGTV